jgi:penicillin-binding protein 1C
MRAEQIHPPLASYQAPDEFRNGVLHLPMKITGKIKQAVSIVVIITVAFLYLSAQIPIPATQLTASDIESLRLVDRQGTLLREALSSADGRGQWIALGQISPWVISCLIHTEDRKFFFHKGVDPAAIVRAASQNVSSGRIVSGGSTISQQLIRQIYKLPRSPFGKIAEMWLALRLEKTLNKAEILEHYLNRAPFGNQTFGIAAASRLYFGKPAAHLTLAESAFLAGLPQAPSAYDPFRHLDRARARQQRVLHGMFTSGVIDSTQFNAALAESLAVVPRPKNFLAPHACDLALSILPSSAPVSRSVRLTIDAALQSLVEKILASNLKLLERANVTNGAALVIDNQTGEILALAGSADYFDDEHGGQVNGALALRQPGSALKPFMYGIALERGFTPATILPDIPTHTPMEGGGDFTPTNYDGKFHGPVRLRTALACSYNVPAVRVMETLGADLLLQRLQAAGFSSLIKSAQHYGLGLTLGNGEVSLLELTRGFLALANQGVVKNLRLFADEPHSPLAPVAEQQIFSREIAFLLADILSDDAARAPAFGEGSVLDLPFPCAVKTGTTKDFRDNWAVGFTSDYTVGVWVGNFDGSAMRQISGVSGAGPIFRDLMLTLHRNTPPRLLSLSKGPNAKPEGLIAHSICTVSGGLPNEFCPNQMTEYFLIGTEPAAVCDWHRIIDAPAQDGFHFASLHNDKGTSQLTMLYPPMYQPWATSEGITQPLLLGEARGEEREAKSGERTAPSDQRPASKIQITSPDDGDIFKIDPVLRPEFQTLLLECIVEGGFNKVTWLVDGVPIAIVGPPFRARWQLKRGEHVVQVMASSKTSKVVNTQRRFLVF